MSGPAAVYRIFKREDGTPSVRLVIAVVVVVAALLTAIGVIRVTRQHEVLRLGLELSKSSQRVRELREVRRQLELEYATLTSPDRIRRLATQLGMAPIAPEQIRLVAPTVAGPRKVARR
jgi:cell division protein FtsL